MCANARFVSRMTAKTKAIEPFWGSNICEICCEDIVDGNPITTYMSSCGVGGLALRIERDAVAMRSIEAMRVTDPPLRRQSDQIETGRIELSSGSSRLGGRSALCGARKTGNSFLRFRRSVSEYDSRRGLFIPRRATGLRPRWDSAFRSWMTRGSILTSRDVWLASGCCPHRRMDPTFPRCANLRARRRPAQVSYLQAVSVKLAVSI